MLADVATILRAEGLTKRFGALTAVDGLDLEVREGEVFGFLGPNGAGKTTTLRLFCALIAPTSGTAEIAGARLGRDDALIRSTVGILTEQPGLYERQSGSSAPYTGSRARPRRSRPTATCGSWASGTGGTRPSRRSRAG
jgi:ABC-type multidrug transport system ATPase subunit